MNKSITFARRVFFWAGIYGIIVLFPLYFLEDKLGRDFPPAINHPENFYGFISVALAWQFVFLIISRDVVRYRLFMLPAVAEKLIFSPIVFYLYANGRVATAAVPPAVIDTILGILFIVCYFLCSKQDAK